MEQGERELRGSRGRQETKVRSSQGVIGERRGVA